MVQKTCRGIQSVLLIEEILLNHNPSFLRLGRIGVVLEVGYQALAIRVLEVEDVVLVLIVLVNAHGLYAVFLPYVVATLPVLFLFLLLLLHGFALLPSLAFDAFLVLYN